MANKTVLIVDDSAVFREILSTIINSIEGFEVNATACDPIEASRLIIDRKPDIMTLDVEMPKMDGLSYLEKVMRLSRMPVVIISAFVNEGSKTKAEALELGAVDCILKPDDEISLAAETFKLAIKETLKKCSNFI